MRIKEIGISRLFGLFNHEIPMKMSDRVTIITGPNGYGKTTILRLVDSLIGGRYAEVRRVPFRDFRITFEDGRTIQVVRVDAPRPANRVQGGADLMISLLRGEKQGRASDHFRATKGSFECVDLNAGARVPEPRPQRPAPRSCPLWSESGNRTASAFTAMSSCRNTCTCS